jgi:L-ribulose-5-phosphate 3-epimerase
MSSPSLNSLVSMTLSCFTNSYGRFGPAACIEHIRSAGLSHVELAVKTEGVPSIFGEQPILTDRSTADDVADVQRLLQEHDVSLSSCNITSGNPLDDNVVEITLRKLDLAQQLGVDLVVAGAGESRTRAERMMLWDHLKWIGDAAGERGITYCFETHPGMAQNAGRMAEAMLHLRHPHLRLNFDTGNILFYNEGADVVEELRRVREWVRHVHLKDHTGRPGEWHFSTFGTGGAVDFAAVGQLLEEVDFDGPCSLEIEGIHGEEALSVEQHHQRVLDSVVHLRQCGFEFA